MKIEKLYEGQVFKNYKELCKELEIEVKQGNSKKTQIKEIERYCLLEKKGHNIIIKEVFSVPLPERKGRGRNNVYGDLLQLLVTDYLIDTWKRTEKYTITMTRNALLEEVKMINHNYSICSANVTHLSTLTQIDSNVIYDFFNSTNSTFKYSLESCLDNLRNNALIMYSKITIVADSKGNHRNATEIEKEKILIAEKEALTELGYKRISQVRVSKNWENFKRLVKTKLKDTEKCEFEYYYSSYEIIMNRKEIENSHNEMLIKTLSLIEREESKDNLNAIICDRLLENAINRRSKTKIESPLFQLRHRDDYVENNEKLISILIDKSSDNIKGTINRMNGSN